MRLSAKIYLGIGLVLAGSLAAVLYNDTLRIRAEFEQELRVSASDLQTLIIALRDVYQKEFLASGLPVDDNTIGLLPAHAMSDIADKFRVLSNNGTMFRNVSDRARNQANRADRIELEAIQYFRENREAKELFVPYRDDDGVLYYHLAAPLWVKAHCLNCHGPSADAPPSVRARYDSGFDYQVGELRGVMSIKMPASQINTRIAAHRRDALLHHSALFAIIFLLIGAGLHLGFTGRLERLQRAAALVGRGEYGQSVKISGKDEMAQLAESFNTMADTVRQREQQLREREALQRTVVQCTQDAIVMGDHEGRIRLFNPIAQKMFGYTEEEVKGLPVSILIPDGMRGAHISGFNRYMRDGDSRMIDHGPIDLIARRRGGETFPIELSLGMDSKAKNKIFVASIREVTERRRKSAEDQAIAELLRLAVSPLGLDEYLRKSLHTLLAFMDWRDFDGRAEIRREQAFGLSGQITLTARYGPSEILIEENKHPTDNNTSADVCQAHIHGGGTRLGTLVLHTTHEYNKSVSCQLFAQKIADVLGAGIFRRKIETALEDQAYRDALTGLANRRLLQDLVRQELAIVKRRHLHGAVLFIDLDHFKTINDGLGHSVGDQLLIQVANRLLGALREGDTVTRIGGDEFVVLLPAIGNDEDNIGEHASKVAEKLRLCINQPYELSGLTYQLTASIGVALLKHSIVDCDEIMKHADTAMYEAKTQGRNRVCFYQPKLKAAADTRLFLQRELRDVTKRSEISLAYQAQVDMNGSPIGAEVLARWHHPERGIISPAEFIPVAEDTGLIIELGEWVFKEACTQARRWADAGKLNKLSRLAINVSPKQFHQPDFVDLVRELVSADKPLPLRLELELTEGIAIDNVDDVIHKMTALKDLGVGIALDDFGTGYSSLAYLKQLPLDVLKIDQSFIRDVNRDPQDAAVVETILSMADIMGVEVIAEGVETKNEFSFLKERGCHFYQGYLFGTPMPAAEFEAWINTDNPVAEKA